MRTPPGLIKYQGARPHRQRHGFAKSAAVPRLTQTVDRSTAVLIGDVENSDQFQPRNVLRFVCGWV